MLTSWWSAPTPAPEPKPSDDARSDISNEDNTEEVDPDQGNGKGALHMPLRRCCSPPGVSGCAWTLELCANKLRSSCSALAYNCPPPARRRFEPGRAANLYPRTPEHARADHKVNIILLSFLAVPCIFLVFRCAAGCCQDDERRSQKLTMRLLFSLPFTVLCAIPRCYCPFLRLRTRSRDLLPLSSST